MRWLQADVYRVMVIKGMKKSGRSWRTTLFCEVRGIGSGTMALAQGEGDSLHFKEFVEAGGAALAAESAFLDAPKGALGAGGK
jgi:hypothetical protein